jgi:hypothetical protein
MKNYILIQNDGEIESNSFELIGASTKRNQEGKIGFFGSGLKYSIAYMMRKGIEFKVFSGENEMVFTTKPETLKDQTFDRICINGTSTSYTTTMGPTWTEDWYVLREIYCNAVDESNCTLVKDTETVSPTAGKTRIYIELTEKLTNVVSEWDKYFSDEREPIFVAPKIYTSSIGYTDGSASKSNYQPVSVYRKTNGVLYRRGVNVATKDKFIFDYEMQFIDINEDRTAKNLSGLDYAFADMIGQMCDDEWVKCILRTGDDNEPCAEYQSTRWHVPDQTPSDRWVEFSETNLLVVKEVSGKFVDQISMTKKECFLIPAEFARYLKKALGGIVILGMGKVIGNSAFSEVDKTAKMEYLLKEVLNSLSEMKYEVPFDILVAEFTDEKVMGQADIQGKTIYISPQTFDMGRRELALTLMEETEHIRSGQGDETRAFQTHIFSQWLKMIEDATGLFL